MNGKSQNKAFTLVEMLIGLALIGMIVSMVYGSYAAMTRSLGVYSGRLTCSDRAQLVLRLMGRQLHCAYAPPAPAAVGRSNIRPGPLSPGGIAPSSEIVFQGDPREIDGEILSFLTTSGLSLGPDKPGGLARVSYRYETKKGLLSLRCEPAVYSSDRPRDSQVWRPVLGGITDLDLEFHNGQRWQPMWSAREITRLPQAVKLLVSITDEGGRSHRYETAVTLACRSSVPRQQRRIQAGPP